jgi:hypothetical protein
MRLSSGHTILCSGQNNNHVCRVAIIISKYVEKTLIVANNQCFKERGEMRTVNKITNQKWGTIRAQATIVKYK